MLTEANVTRLVSKLSQMRGAALKIGQFLSIQGVSGCSSSGSGYRGGYDVVNKMTHGRARVV